MAISSAGIGSGLDVNGIVSRLMALEQRPLAALAGKEARYQAQVSAYGSVKGALSAFQSAAAALATPAKFTALKASVGDTAVASASASATAAAGTYSLEVQTLAQAHKVKSAAFAATTTVLGTGKLTISFGTYSGDTFTANPDKASKEITIAAGQNTLAGVRDAINGASAGVTASIVNDGSGNRLTISSKDSGVANALRVEVADDDGTHTNTSGLSQLAYDARTVSGVTNLTESVAARNATLKIDGIIVSKPSNTITDALEGVTLNLLKENTPAATTLTVARDSAGVQAAVQGFVKAYNDLNKTVTELTKYDAATKKASTLTGEATIRSIQAQLRSVFNTPLSASAGGYTSLSQVGVTFQRDGSLALDTAKLSAALGDSTKDVSALFAAFSKASDSQVTISSVGSSVQPGTYAVNVTQFSTQGKAVGGSAATLLITSAVNDSLTLAVDGTSASVTLAGGVYTAESLAAEIESKVNAHAAIAAANAAVTVTQSGGVLTVTSNRYGSASTVALTGGTARPGLFGTHSEQAGLDSTATIGGAPAIATGNTLTGTGSARGLVLTVAGTSLGDRGTVTIARGYAHQLDKVSSDMLKSDSVIGGRISGINSSIQDLGEQREALDRRLQQIEKRYRAQFSALDSMMGRMQQTSSFLSQQLANLPKSS